MHEVISARKIGRLEVKKGDDIMRGMIFLIAIAAIMSGAIVLIVLWKFDHDSGPADRISLSLTAANVTYTAILIYLSSKSKALSSLIAAYISAARRNSSGPSKKAYREELDHRVAQCIPRIREITDGVFSKEKPSHCDFTEDLYAGSRVSITAVSSIDPECYWMNDNTRRRANTAQRDAIERGVRVTRYFIFEDSATAIAFFEIMNDQRSSGVDVWYVLISDVHERLRSAFSSLDCSVYDDYCVQFFEFESGQREVYSRCTVSALDEHLAKIREQLRALAEYKNRLPDEIKLMHGFDEISAKSTATNPSTKNYYGDARSLAPDLKLHLLLGLPKELSVLDIGCGGGRMVKALAASFDCDYIGIDRDPIAIQSSRDMLINQKKSRFKQHEFLDYVAHVKDDSFDIVIAYNSIYHANRDDFFSAITQAHRCTKKGGYFLLTIKTVVGNEHAMKPRPGFSRISVDAHNSYLNCNFPDHGNIHHFCNDNEIEQIKSMFLLVHEEQSAAKIDPITSEVIHGAGTYFILQKP